MTLDGTSGSSSRANITVAEISSSSYPQYATGTIDLVTGVAGTSTLSGYVNQMILGYMTTTTTPIRSPARSTWVAGRWTQRRSSSATWPRPAAPPPCLRLFALNGGTVLAGTLTLANSAAAGTVSGTFNLNSGLVSATLIASGAGGSAAPRVFNWSSGTIANYNPAYGLGGDSAESGLTISIPTITMAASGTHTFWIDAGQTGTVSSVSLRWVAAPA